MYIKSIVLDGFKSYGNRVEITGFDPEFNAITGLNGTGKSNILDSICFVLGITNLSNVRAGSLQELIYKHGQAGITKATVSITFDNTNKAQQPIGYDSKEITVTRQVVMGGKNKYMINGNNVQNKRVSDLFCSVQLNVNNPHFLIMQGRITKVLNMKPPEILSMVEEAAGTRMYETKKQSAEKIIEKKDAKLRELNDIIKEDIAPRLQKLQDERSQFQDYQKVVRELENLTKLHIAWKYVTAEEKTKEAESKVAAVRDNIDQLKETIEKNKLQMKEITNNIEKLNKELDQESGSILATLEQSLQEAEKREACSGAAVKAAHEVVTALQRRLIVLEKSLKDDTVALADKKATEEKVTATFSDIKSAHERSEAELAAATQRFLAVSSGLEGDSESLQDQLMGAKKAASEASTRVLQANMERSAARARLDRAELEFSTNAAHYTRDQDTIARHETLLQQIQTELSRLEFSESSYSSAERQARTLEGSVRRQRDAVDTLAASLQRCHFRYNAPHASFRSTQVLGTVCRLFEVCDPKYCTAIETAAGGKLYNVVVDTEETSKLLLQRGGLTTRTTIVPLNKIRGHVIDAATVRLAQEVGGGPEAVQLALELVSFARELQPAMAWALGGTLVCVDMEAARRVAFHPRVRRRTVTLQGDVFDPAGTVSGGAAVKGGSVLLRLQELRQLERELEAAEEQVASCTRQLRADKDKADKYHALKQKEEMTSHELRAARARLATTSHQQLHDEIATLKEQIETLSASIEKDEELQKQSAARASELEDKVKDIKGHRDREFKKAQDALAAARRAAEQNGTSWKLREQEVEALRLETLELEQAVIAANNQLQELNASLSAKKIELNNAKEEHKTDKEGVGEVQARLRHHKEQMSRGSSELRSLAAQRERLEQDNRAAELCVHQLEIDIKDTHAEAEACRKKICALEREHAWISSEREYFGAAGGAYDLTARAAHTSGARVAALTQRRDKLARGLNARAHTLLAKEEECYQEVLRKKAIVEADRAKLVQVMQQLDEKKERTLVAACERVTRDFGSIFSTLLPGAHASLAPPPGLSVLDGLEVRVGFNGAWKESLGELSGGQRSLVALSLVLALLLFKPAPLYILDEVDAALDLSHTQNIGIMLKEHFKHSQFIIVSLKDGMFNNANVLFRTRFVDGMSSVQRTRNLSGK